MKGHFDSTWMKKSSSRLQVAHTANLWVHRDIEMWAWNTGQCPSNPNSHRGFRTLKPWMRGQHGTEWRVWGLVFVQGCVWKAMDRLRGRKWNLGQGIFLDTENEAPKGRQAQPYSRLRKPAWCLPAPTQALPKLLSESQRTLNIIPSLLAFGQGLLLWVPDKSVPSK